LGVPVINLEDKKHMPRKGDKKEGAKEHKSM